METMVHVRRDPFQVTTRPVHRLQGSMPYRRFGVGVRSGEAGESAAAGPFADCGGQLASGEPGIRNSSPAPSGLVASESSFAGGFSADGSRARTGLSNTVLAAVTRRAPDSKGSTTVLTMNRRSSGNSEIFRCCNSSSSAAAPIPATVSRTFSRLRRTFGRGQSANCFRTAIFQADLHTSIKTRYLSNLEGVGRIRFDHAYDGGRHLDLPAYGTGHPSATRLMTAAALGAHDASCSPRSTRTRIT